MESSITCGSDHRTGVGEGQPSIAGVPGGSAPGSIPRAMAQLANGQQAAVTAAPDEQA